METLNRTDLTQYETERLHQTARRVRDYGREVGQFVVRYGNESDLTKAADLYLALLDELTSDTDIRTEALGYGLAFAHSKANDNQTSQASRLEGDFLVMLYRNAIANRE